MMNIICLMNLTQLKKNRKGNESKMNKNKFKKNTFTSINIFFFFFNEAFTNGNVLSILKKFKFPSHQVLYKSIFFYLFVCMVYNCLVIRELELVWLFFFSSYIILIFNRVDVINFLYNILYF